MSSITRDSLLGGCVLVALVVVSMVALFLYEARGADRLVP